MGKKSKSAKVLKIRMAEATETTTAEEICTDMYLDIDHVTQI